jgi:small subunit ribosomal protein S8
MINDTISDMLTCIRNGILIKNQTVTVLATKINKNIAKILEREGFIESFQITNSGKLVLKLKYLNNRKKSSITNLRRLSKPGLRIYVNSKEIPRILGGLGIVILSTSKGIMTDSEARYYKIGGELLCSIW